MFFDRQALEQELDHNPFREIFDNGFGKELEAEGYSKEIFPEISHEPKSQEEEKSKESQSSNQPTQDQETKKLKSKLRSRKARKRKKEYLEELEARVKHLEKENIRLFNIVNQTKPKIEREPYIESKTTLTDFDKEVRKLWSNVIDLETLDKKEAAMSIADIWDNECWKLLEKHKSFIDSVIKMLINNIHGNSTPPYWKDLTEEYTTDYNIIKKLNSRTKYQIPEFMETHELNELDLFVASLNPTKNQFNFLKNVLLKKEYEVKTKCQEAIKKLLDAKTLIQESYGEQFLCGGLFLAKSGIFQDEQVINSKLKESIFKREDNIEQIWKIKSEPYTLTYKLSRDKIIGRAIKQHFSKDMYNIDLEFSKFYIDVAQHQGKAIGIEG
ncbi:unnamed protein product [Moneuplotes crassus]|uniref:BZIP domain-containing protein n=1 Tax=Euplotes crassus TaxID=5936 RepID=A0AAD1UMF4_EUPCR|nr:unnamed protein product [Moneuplotes crassus]